MNTKIFRISKFLILTTIVVGGIGLLIARERQPSSVQVVATQPASTSETGGSSKTDSYSIDEHGPVDIERTPARVGTGRSDLIMNPFGRMEALGGSPTIESAFANIFDESLPDDLRYWSAVAAGQSQDQRSLPILLDALRDSNSTVRAGALVGLKYLGDPAAISEVAMILSYDPSNDVRQLALVTLVKTRDEEVGNILVRTAVNIGQPEDIRLSAIQGIEHIKLANAHQDLQPMLDDKSPNIRASVAIYLSRAEPQDLVPKLVEAALDRFTGSGMKADVALRLQEITGQDFGLLDPAHNRDPIKNQADRAEEKIRTWWSENNSRYELSDI